MASSSSFPYDDAGEYNFQETAESGNSTIYHGLWGQEWQKALILTTCILSVLGSLLIIASWVLFRDLRSRTRQILVCLSIADLGVALANGVGVLYHKVPLICKIQAGVAAFSASSSFLWTISLAIYLYTTVVLEWPVARRSTLVLMHIINWGIPVAVVSSAAGLGVLGGDPGYSTAWQGWWCILRRNITTTESIVYLMVISEAWAYIAYLLIPFLFLMTRHHIIRETKHYRTQFMTSGSLSAAQAVDRKLAVLPMIFILLHLWASILCIKQMHHMLHGDTVYDPSKVSYQVLHLLQGIGDSAQGFANAVFFCLLTRKVRGHFAELLWRCFRCLFPWKQSRSASSYSPSSWLDIEATDSIQTGMEQSNGKHGERQPLLSND